MLVNVLCLIELLVICIQKTHLSNEEKLQCLCETDIYTVKYEMGMRSCIAQNRWGHGAIEMYTVARS